MIRAIAPGPQPLTFLLGELEYLLGLPDVHGERLLAEDVLAGVDDHLAEVEVGGVEGADVDHVHLGVGGHGGVRVEGAGDVCLGESGTYEIDMYFLVQKSKGKANPQMANQMLKEKLS